MSATSKPKKNNSLSKILKPIVNSNTFNYVVLFVIIFSAILVGFGLNITPTSVWYPVISFLELLILIFFGIELILRILAEENPLNFFKDPWNTFDFIIVLICFIPFKDKTVYVLRLVRVLRTFRLFRAFPNLKPVISGLLNSISSVIFVALLLTIVLYIYAVIGVSLFGAVDPTHFGSLWKGLFTLFQILTLENWNTIMLPSNAAYPIGGPLYFISFIIIGTMIIMNLFLGIIIGNMSKSMDKLNSPEKMKNYLDEDAVRERKLANKLTKIEKELE
ncbi:MAG: ion transporter, partial [archaeon]